VTLLASPPHAVPEQETPDLLIQEARRRQRHRWLAVVSAVVIGATSYAVVQVTSTGTPSILSLPLLSRPLHLPSLGPNGSCPTSTATSLNTPVTGRGPYLGDGPVRLDVGNGGNLARGQVILGGPLSSGWYGIETIWVSLPSYQGPFIVRGARIGSAGRIDVWRTNQPNSGPFVAPAGRAGYGNYEDGYRALPDGVHVGAPGCYGIQVDGRGFSEVIVVEALPYRAPAA